MKEMLMPLVYVFIGGGFGSVLRFLVSMGMRQVAGSHYPFGTLTVNIVGCFFIGFLITFIESRSVAFPYWRQLIVIGILGGFTTFSSFSWESLTLLRNNETTAAFLNIALSLGLCLGASFLGMWAGKA